MMREHDNTEMWAAMAIGAIVGVGAALLVRARQEDQTHDIIKAIRPLRERTAKATEKIVDGAESFAKAASKATRRRRRRRIPGFHKAGPLDAGRDALEDLSSRAREIVESTRRELEKAARDTVKEARKAARRVAR
jgi:gas vesicle protein